MRDAFRPTLSLLLLLSAVGCGAKSDGPETYPVTGVVTLAGAPVEGAIVQFTPTSADTGLPGAQTTTQSDGTFAVKINLDMGKTTKPGLPPGDYKVAVTKLQTVAGQTAPNIPPKNVLPPKYAKIESSPLTATVKADGENKLEFPLVK